MLQKYNIAFIPSKNSPQFIKYATELAQEAPADTYYDPHMTLFNSHAEKACEYFNRAPQVNPPFKEEFNIALGLIDEVGQITEILFS